LTKSRSRFSGAQHCLCYSIVLIGFLTLTGCGREPLDCTPLGRGTLAFSELRGDQDGDDTAGQWIELYNTSASDLNIAGVRLIVQKPDGSGEKNFLVRDHYLTIPANGYIVLGHMPTPGSLPDHMDYEFGAEFPSKLYKNGVLTLEKCEETIDWIFYQDLPDTGSLAFDGNLSLTSETNDQQANWCDDDIIVPPAVGALGTPGEENRPCP
jgi:hypothetical protein